MRSLGDLRDEEEDSDSEGEQGNELFTGGAKRCGQCSHCGLSRVCACDICKEG